jgi:hypothetical protein
VSESLQAAAAVDGPLLQRGGGGFGAYMGGSNDVTVSSAATGSSSSSRRTLVPGCIAVSGPGDGPLSSYGSVGRTSGLLGTSAGRDVDPFAMPAVGVAQSGIGGSRIDDGIGQVSIEFTVHYIDDAIQLSREFTKPLFNIQFLRMQPNYINPEPNASPHL